MKVSIFTILFICISFNSLSQETEEKEPNTIEGQFDRIYRISTSYQTYKVIGKDKFILLKKNVLDSIKDAKLLISEKENLLINERKNVTEIKAELTKTKLDLEEALQKENSISIFGAQLDKVTYNLILWFIIIALALGFVFFIFKFSKSNILTKKAQNNLLDVEENFEDHRKKSLEREQKLRRQLQDEINKQRNS